MSWNFLDFRSFARVPCRRLFFFSYLALLRVRFRTAVYMARVQNGVGSAEKKNTDELASTILELFFFFLSSILAYLWASPSSTECSGLPRSLALLICKL